MATRLFLNGQIAWSSQREHEPRFIEPLPDPIGYVGFPKDPNFVDGPWDLRYRRIDKALETDYWLTMSELRQVTGKNEAWVARKVQDGELDAAMVRGTSVPLFRILDRAAVVREALIEERKPPKPGSLENKARSKKDRWDLK